MSLSSESPSNLSDSSFASSFLDNGDDVGYNEPLPFEDWPSPEKLLLHGNLDIWIDKARNLPHSRHLHRKLIDKVHKEVSHKLRKHLHIHDSSESLGKKLRSKMASEFHKHMPHLSEHFVSIWLSKVDAKAKKKSKAAIGRSRVIRDDWDPLWNQYFSVPVAHYAGEVGFVVENNDLISAQRVGAVTIPAAHIVSGVKIEGTFPLYNSEREPTGAVLSISIQYTPIERLGIYSRGVRSSPESDGSGSGVQGAYFPLRKGGIVKLYQDAHVPDGHLPEVKLDHGLHYEHGKCWEDICEAICGARRLVYIAGWAVNHKIRLVRENGFTSGCRLTLGELLKTKSEEGVRVLLLVWDDPTSWQFSGFKFKGKMDTYDEEIHHFFKHSSVNVLLGKRIAAGRQHGMLKKQEAALIYTHHQKIVVVDSDAGNNMRKITAFIGGLDLCQGRYDSPIHPLFATQQTVHKDDFYNPNFKAPPVHCPRQPWHDLHCKVDGPAAYDVLINFEERWKKASELHGIDKLIKLGSKYHYTESLLKIDNIPEILGMLNAPWLSENDPEAWHVQVLRSIDSNSVKDFPTDPTEVAKKNLVYGKDVVIDMSIHSAYVKAIRAAQHFIYIENQYFLGSSYNWSSKQNTGANNLIPMEIALKIVNKIKKNERFSVYIIIPMWPEGIPTGKTVQAILYWQHKTMKMMYKMVYKALEESGLEKMYVPEDYLNFFCLGNREEIDQNGSASCHGKPAKWEEDTPQKRTGKSTGRFMIYVHSKGMIVDDEYVILGSANINQRSMAGNRDTEIAIGAYQPQHTWTRKPSGPRGQVHGYRMSLWAEHMGTLEECFGHPESLECTKRVRALGEQNWKQYAAASDEVGDMKGHLLKYPIKVDMEGNVKRLDGYTAFPDVGGEIKGTFEKILENITT